MKRDMDLLRAILLTIESEHDSDKVIMLEPEMLAKDFPNLSNTDLQAHVRLLIGCAYLIPSESRLAGEWLKGITMSGYDFLDSVRDPEMWRRTKETANKVGGWTMKSILEIAMALAADSLKEMFGVNQ